jgi:hypothetical protein
VEILRFSRFYFYFPLKFFCRSSLSLIVDTAHLSNVLAATDSLCRLESAAQSLAASTQCMFSPKRQSLFRAPIFRCFNQRASMPRCIASKACSLTCNKPFCLRRIISFVTLLLQKEKIVYHLQQNLILKKKHVNSNTPLTLKPLPMKLNYMFQPLVI